MKICWVTLKFLWSKIKKHHERNYNIQMNKAILRNSKIVIFGKKIISGNFFFQPARSETFFFHVGLKWKSLSNYERDVCKFHLWLYRRNTAAMQRSWVWRAFYSKREYCLVFCTETPLILYLQLPYVIIDTLTFSRNRCSWNIFHSTTVKFVFCTFVLFVWNYFLI